MPISASRVSISNLLQRAVAPVGLGLKSAGASFMKHIMNKTYR